MDIAADIGEADVAAEAKDYTKHFISQVTYDRFKELMAEASDIIGPGSNYTRDNLLLYYGQVEMDYEEAVDEYHTTIYDDKVTIAFARLFCDYLSRTLGLYPVFSGCRYVDERQKVPDAGVNQCESNRYRKINYSAISCPSGSSTYSCLSSQLRVTCSTS